MILPVNSGPFSIIHAKNSSVPLTYSGGIPTVVFPPKTVSATETTIKFKDKEGGHKKKKEKKRKEKKRKEKKRKEKKRKRRGKKKGEKRYKKQQS
jgi:hypothetical protein